MVDPWRLTGLFQDGDIDQESWEMSKNPSEKAARVSRWAEASHRQRPTGWTNGQGKAEAGSKVTTTVEWMKRYDVKEI